MEGIANISREVEPLYEAARLVCAALDFAPNGFAIVCLDGSCLTVNRTLAGWILPAVPVDEVRGVSLLSGDDGSLRAALRRASLGESVIVETSSVQLLRGRPGPWRLHVMPFRVGGTVQAASVAFEDRSEQASIVEAFEASERRLRLIVDSASDGVAVHRKGILLYVNPAGVRTLGYDSADEMVGRPVLDFVHPAYRDRARRRLQELADSGRVPLIEEVFVRKDGDSVTVEVSASRAPHDGTLSNFIFVRDVTDRKHFQAELERAARMESLGRLAGCVAHDFNNLLSGIQCSLELARLRTNEPAALSGALDAASAAAQRAADVTRQLLTFSQRGGGTRAQAIEPSAVVREAVNLLGTMNGEDIQVECCFKPSGRVWMDASQLHQVVLNLLLNARDALPDGGRIEVGLSEPGQGADVLPPARPGRWLALSVADNGSGMDAATRARIFEPFFSTKAPGQGTGLGLSTVYGVVQQAGGWIELSSQLGVGSRFVVYLPLCDTGSVEMPATGVLQTCVTRSPQVLICDDEQRLAMLTAALLRQHGYRTTTVSSVEETIVALEREGRAFDALLLDVNLPHGSAGRVLERMQQIGCAVPVILTSGYSVEDVASELLGDPHVVHYLAKPYPLEELVGVLDRVHAPDSPVQAGSL